MDALTFDLMRIWRNNADGSYATRANRRRMLALMAATLKEGGYRLDAAHSLKPKHVEFLIDTWRTAGLDPRTMKNRLGVIRWWAEAVNKSSIMRRRNEDYGIVAEERAGRSRAQDIDPERLAKVACPLARMSLELQAAMGLRVEESLKFKPAQAIGRDAISIQGSWAKGGRPRRIPITSGRQREVLARALALAPQGSLIPAEKKYIQQLNVLKYQMLKAGIRNAHGYRHGYAQRRYAELTGRLAPLAGGSTPATPEEMAADLAARQTISHELGHGRLIIVRTYLG